MAAGLALLLWPARLMAQDVSADNITSYPASFFTAESSSW